MKRNDSMLVRHLSTLRNMKGAVVLEIGCGNGELTHQLSNLVGPEGTIIALDNNEQSLAAAERRAEEFEFSNVQFVSSDISSPPFDLKLIESNSIDVLVGRRILMYLKNPSTVIKELSKYLKQGGLAVFQESDPTAVPASIADMPAHDKANQWIKSMLLSEGVHMSMGLSLPRTLIDSGLEFEKVFAEAVIQGQGEQFLLSDMIKVLTQRLINTGISNQKDIDSLTQELIRESEDNSKVYISDMSFCAWAKKI